MKRIVLLTILMICLFVFAMCGEEVSSTVDAARSDGGGEDAYPDGDTVVQYGSLTVKATAAGVEVNADINLDGQPTGFRTPYTFTSLSVGKHSVLLSYPGRLQAPSPMEVDVTPEGANVNIILYRDLTGSWMRESDGKIVEVKMHVFESTGIGCPDTPVIAGPFDPLSGLCVEADDTLSVCKTQAPECDGLYATGRILDDGQRVEFDHNIGLGDHVVYKKISQ